MEEHANEGIEEDDIGGHCGNSVGRGTGGVRLGIWDMAQMLRMLKIICDNESNDRSNEPHHELTL